MLIYSDREIVIRQLERLQSIAEGLLSETETLIPHIVRHAIMFAKHRGTDRDHSNGLSGTRHWRGREPDRFVSPKALSRETGSSQS